MNRRLIASVCLLSLAAAGSASAQPEEGLRPMIQIQPDYPAAAAERGVQGYVELDVRVAEDGRVEQAAVVVSVPEGVFDDAARAAVMRWRYPSEPGRTSVSVNERLEFRASAAAAAAAVPAPANEPALVAARRGMRGGPRNACVREESKFNYGDRVDVVLINSCNVPLVVIGCAAGTGQYSGRWACATTESAATLLVPPSDSRVGELTLVDSSDGTAALTFVDRFVLSRAPNSEYWWLACTLEDASCRAASRDWIRSLDGQLASADPRGRANVTLARSY